MKNIFYRKLFLRNIFCIVLLFCVFLVPNYCHAFYAWPDFIGFSYGEMLAKISRQVEGAIRAAQKQAALQLKTQTINNTISGGNGSGPLFVTSWEDFLFNETKGKADLFMNDFFSSITSGRGSVANYSGYGAKGNYQSALISEAKKITTGSSISTCKITNASSMFDGKDWTTFAGVFGEDTCNRFGFNNIATEQYITALYKEQKKAEVQGIAYEGFKSVTSGKSNSVIAPGSSVANVQFQTQDLGNKMLASATSSAETLISALVTKLSLQTIQQGIGQAQQYIQKEVNNKTSNYSEQIKNQINPGQKYKLSY